MHYMCCSEYLGITKLDILRFDISHVEDHSKDGKVTMIQRAALRNLQLLPRATVEKSREKRRALAK